MNVSPRAESVVRRFATRVGLKSGPFPSPPRLKLHPPATGTPTVWFIAPDWDKPSGGLRKIYRSVDVLTHSGIRAAVVHKRSDFRCTWFENTTPVIPANAAHVTERDVIVVPEIYGPTVRSLPPGVRQVILNQNVYITLEQLADHGDQAATAYTENPDLATVATVSDHNTAVLRYLFPSLDVRRITWAVDPMFFPSGARDRIIAYMPRRRPHDSRQVLEILRRRRVLDSWRVVSIDNRSEAEVARILRSSSIFLSFSEREGLGLPPLEALASGCLVVGFDGFAGTEFFASPSAFPVQDGDVVALAMAVEELTSRVDADPRGMQGLADDGSTWVLQRYSQTAERESLVQLFEPLLDAGN